MRIPVNQVFYLQLFFILCTCFSACQKWVSIPPPVTQVTADGAFSNDLTATTTVKGLSSQIMADNLSLLNGALSVYAGLSSDELQLSGTDAVAEEFADNSLSSRNTEVSKLWSGGYQYLYQINASLEGIRNSDGISAGTKNQLTGELLFVRGFVNFYLVNLFGDVPLTLTTDYTANSIEPRAPSGKVYLQIEEDLAEADSLLALVSSVKGATEPTQMAAVALLARVHLYRQEWPEAEAAASRVISSGIYTLESEPAGVFLPGSTETILQFVPVIPGVNTAEALNFIPAAEVRPPYLLSSSLLSSFEPDDRRRAMWTDGFASAEGMLYYPFKYKAKSSGEGSEYSVFLRLGEQYLIRAEARAAQGDISEAASDLNMIRDRAGLLPLAGTMPVSACLTAIAKENQTEFFAEWGHRWFDLIRTGKAAEVLAPVKSGWQVSDTLYPIPYSQLLVNPALVQNAGY